MKNVTSLRSSIVIAGLLTVLFVSGCASGSAMRTGSYAAPTDPAAVRMYVLEKPVAPYEEIGRVCADKYTNFATTRSGDGVNAIMRSQAASIGADAIINVTEDFAQMSGVAVKFKK